MLAFALGHFDEAIALYKQSLAIDPLATSTHSNLAAANYYSGRLDEAEAAIRKVIELNPAHASAYYELTRIQLAQGKPEAALESIQKETDEIWRTIGLPLVYFKMGRKAEADAALRMLIEKYADGSPYQVAEAYACRGEKDLAFQWLEHAYRQRDGGLSEMKGDPLLANISNDARYLPFLKKMKLDDESISKIESRKE